MHCPNELNNGVTWISGDAKVEQVGLHSQQDVRHWQASESGVHIPAEAKHLIAKLSVGQQLQQQMEVDEGAVP